MEDLNALKVGIVSVIGALTGFWGWFGWLVVCWVCMMCLDYLTGSMAAAKNGGWSSESAREGIWHKCGMIVVVLVAGSMDLVIGTILDNLPLVELPIQYAGLVCPIVLVWYIITEMGSIAENAVDLGAPVPEWLTKILEISKNAVDGAGENVTGESEEKANGKGN